MKLFFSSEDYKKKALEDANKEYESNHSVADAVMLLFKDVDKEDLSNLCNLLHKYYERYQPPIELSLEETYQLTQGNNIDGKIACDENMNELISALAYKCIEHGVPLGNKTIMDGKINTSDWMAHCLWEGKLCGQLAKLNGLDEEKAQKLGILHDYGRKKTHTFEHVIKGYESLSEKGWNAEAIGCITHSFLGGCRCALNDVAEEGFFVDENGNPGWRKDAQKDDATIFLENYNFTEYDDILNIADLMATSYGIVSPAERIADIAKRRGEFDPINRTYFIAEFTNKLREMLENIGSNLPENLKEPVKAKEGVTLEEVTERFECISDVFFNEYKKRILTGKSEINKENEILEI